MVKSITIVGVVLIALGLVAFIYGGITYTSQEEAVKVGPISVTAQTKKTIPLPPVLGAVAVAGGVVLLVLGAKKP